jgi:hypothetical protein
VIVRLRRCVRKACHPAPLADVRLGVCAAESASISV